MPYDSPDTYKRREVRIAIDRKNNHLRLIVQDWGMGIPDEYRERIFRPFFSTKEPHKGMGIGLSITKEIVEKYFQGTIAVKTTPGRGTTFTVTFPHVPSTHGEQLHID